MLTEDIEVLARDMFTLSRYLYGKALPISGSFNPAWEALGFTFGEPLNSHWRLVTFPESWSVQGGKHDYALTIQDDRGRTRGHITLCETPSCSLRTRYCHLAAIMGDAKRFQAAVEAGTIDNDHAVLDSAHQQVLQLFEPDGKLEDYKDRYAYAATATAKAHQWLNEHYPDWKDPTAYWD